MVSRMNNYRIIEVSSNLSISDIYGSIVAHPFDGCSGFLVNKKRKNIIEASHHYKKVVNKIIRDLENNEETVSYYDYVKTDFKIITIEKNPYIIVINPPRESKFFNQDLKKSLPSFTSLKLISKIPISFYNNLVKHGYRIQINEIDISNINIKNKGLGRFTFYSEKDIYNEAMSFVNEKDFDIRYMVMLIELETLCCKCKINSSGIISMAEYNQQVLNLYIDS